MVAVAGLLGCGGGFHGGLGHDASPSDLGHDAFQGDAVSTTGDAQAGGDVASGADAVANDAADDRTPEPGAEAGAGTNGGGGSGGGTSVDGGADVATGNDAAVPDAAPPSLDGGGTIGGDPGTVNVHRLNNLEYDNTMRDLLGYMGSVAQTTFQSDETGEFDNDAEALTINDVRFEQYFDAADAIVEEVFSSTTYAASRAKIMSCTPSTTDTTCTRSIIQAFGPRAWRRPLDASEVDGLVKVATDAVAVDPDAVGSIKQVIKTMLASPPFIFHVEIDPNPSSAVPHALTPYELASRLSYFVWSSMPDDTLFALAASGALWTDAVLTAQVDRMLADPKAASFTESFAGQWLGVRDLRAHVVEPTAFPTFNAALQASMANEELLYFNEFLTGALPMTQFLTADVNFIDATLAGHYGLPAPVGSGTSRVVNTNDQRVGFLGLAGFLTTTSFSYRTSPTRRGTWVLTNLLCQTVPAEPANVPRLDTATSEQDPTAQGENVRARLAAHRAAAACGACHATLDPIGLGLESFDGIGAFRTQYGGGGAIDSSGMLPTGETFSGPLDLATALSGTFYLAELTGCASHKMLTYGLERGLQSADQPYLTQIQTSWAAQGSGLKALMKDIVLNDTFRFRHGEP